MRVKIILFVAFVCLGLILTLPVYGAEKLYKIAVLPFDDGSIQWDEGGWDIGKGIADELVTALLATKKFRLIEREQVEKVLAEQDFGAGNRVDPSSAAKIGKILGVQFLVIGKVTEFSSKSSSTDIQHQSGLGLGIKSTKSIVAIDARMVDTASAEIIASATGKGSKSSGSLSIVKDWNAIAFGSDEFRKTDLGVALRDAVNSVAKQLASTAYSGTNTAQPSKISGLVAFVGENKIVLNIGSGDGVTTGMTFIVNHLLNLIKDPNTGEVIDEETEAVAEISVTEVKDKSTTCTVMKKLSTNYEITVSDKVVQK
jgi:curli biogenesis system outer membrane secretion channel CsgG